MNLDHLKTFREVVRLGSFSEVARKMAITQPAVSFQVQKLEQQLGARLIDRTQRGVVPTTAGKRLLRFAVTVEKERERLRLDLDELREEVSGDLLIAASTMPGEYLLPPLVSRFKRLHPAIRVQVDVSDSLTVIERVRNNSYEVGFCGTAPEGQDLTSFRMAGDEIVLIVPPDHPFAGRSDIAFAELPGEPLIFREATSGTQRSVERFLSGAGLDVSTWVPTLILGSTQAVVSAVAAGAGIGFVSNLALTPCLQQGYVRQVGIKGLRLQRDFYCIYHREMVVSRLLGEFLQYIELGAAHDAGTE